MLGPVLFCMAMVPLVLLVRVNFVFVARGKLIERIYELGKADISAGKEWQWRWKKYEEVSFNLMMVEFWKPLKPEVWWEDTKFLEP